MNIYLKTSNKHKQKEVENIFQGYGLNVSTISPSEVVTDLFLNKNLPKEFFILSEKSKLIIDGVEKSTLELNHLDKVTHKSTSTVSHFKDGEYVGDLVYTSDVEGFIDLTKKETDNEDIYDWDDIMVEVNTMRTYYEMGLDTNKFSARTQSISKFINQLIKFDKKINLNFNPIEQHEVLSFDGEIYDLIDNNKYFSCHENNSMLKEVITHVKNQGLFTRSALNKTQRNYWYPSLNAGLPLVPKKDEIHEVTFMFHDLMHHAVPDLILSGVDTKETREIYVIHRMLSEAITIVLADMVFIDELVKSGYDYDFTKRKIYPIYKEFKKSGVSKDRIKELVWANVCFALLGDNKELIRLSNEDVVYNYQDKYEKFFIEDYRWTVNNYKSMTSYKSEMSSWFHCIEHMIPDNRKLSYFENLIQENDSYQDKVFIIFNKVWDDLFENNKKQNKKSKQECISNAFTNYMIGQLFIFFKYRMNDKSDYLRSLIIEEISKKEIFNANDIHRIRNFYSLYLDILSKNNIITNTQKESYIEIFPFFETFFVFYDKNLAFSSIKDVLNKLVIK